MHKFTESTQLIWQAEGGTIDDKGMFHAGEIEGAYRLSMSAGTLNVYADVTISKEKALPPPPLPKGTVSKVTWQGELQPQKWMNFYTKVLSKFVGKGGLRLNLKVDIE